VIEPEEFLAHYGVRGMKWGVRTRSSSRATKKSTGSSRPSDEGRAAAKILSKQKQHGTAALTNHELRVVNARVKLEKEFKGNFPNKSKLDKGEAHLKKYIAYGLTAKAAHDLLMSDFGKRMTGRGAKIMVTTAAKAVVNNP
jgi:hypothetical protein